MLLHSQPYALYLWQVALVSMPLQMRAPSTRAKMNAWQLEEGRIISALGVSVQLYLLRVTQMRSLKSCLLAYLIAETPPNLPVMEQSQTQPVSKSWAAPGALAKPWDRFVLIL
jgi:hypothetical protein